jgi:hypothetical protein
MTAPTTPHPWRARVASLTHRDDGRHPDWCARGHRCGLGEHRATPVTLVAPGRGVVVLTRVLGADGRQHVEIRTDVTLAEGEPQARAHLTHILAELDAHLKRITRPPRA